MSTMLVISSNMTIAQMAKEFEEKSIIVDHDYQRSLNWPPAARSFLIDTILSGYPLPKLSFAQTTALQTLRTTKAIVDGQQRTAAIVDFLQNKFRISTKNSDFYGKSFKTLEDDDKRKFLGYIVNIDLFIGATDEDVREIFKRMNWYTAPANNQEKRHSAFSGDFKQFITALAKKYVNFFYQTKTFSKKQISRMADTEFLSECAYTYLYGVDHASQGKLDKMYTDYDDAFPMEESLGDTFDKTFKLISAWTTVFDSSITNKTYNFYSLITACMHELNPATGLASFNSGSLLSTEEIQDNLIFMSESLSAEPQPEGMEYYIDACSGATNRLHQRTVRLKYFIAALTTGDFRSVHSNALLAGTHRSEREHPISQANVT